MEKTRRYVAFDGMSRCAEGSLPQITKRVRERLSISPSASILVFDQADGRQTDLDLRNSGIDAAEDDESSGSNSGPGRPKLGVVGREVTLLPRHWDWLNAQPGGASVALRKLVETARRDGVAKDKVRRRQEAAYRFLSAIAGNLPEYEEALRSLFADDQAGLTNRTRKWPKDVREFAMELAIGDQPASRVVR